MDVVRRDGPGPDDAVRVVVLLHYRSDRACDADAVASHHHGPFGARFVEKHTLHRSGVFRSELEDLPHLDAAEGLVPAVAAPGADISFVRHAEIVESLELLQVAVGLEPEVVIAV